ncbi:neuronal acetylcholine receptor subunit alpha-5-like [Folsomia candida]|uniref:Acetylcholine receptor subunit beta-like 1 n=1 Tax=Folsomia candida TaxID=158441 RepID=A0A226CUF9_FOLCA|nr:neuronal acetylcholine receptor subunit alpha-5-like [Folsomia candida]OXA37052.1 Acetylcholine receptor subunit beta-like 1 [Folsomia candida]
MKLFEIIFTFGLFSTAVALTVDRIEYTPTPIYEHDNLELNCVYNLTGEKLYAVKWYYEFYEFFRYVEDETPRTTAFPHDGMIIDSDKSDETKVLLMNVSLALSGSYICEVATDAPRFLAERATTEIQIFSESNRTISHKNGADKGFQNPPLAIRSTLWSKLFGDYNKNLYPDGGAVILVEMSLIDVDMNTEGFMDANVWTKLIWTDSRLKWDMDLTPVEFMTVAEDNLWRPEIFLLNGPKPSGDCSKLGSVLVTPDGNVSWTSSCVYRTFCVWNYALDPCEEQSCGMEFEAWNRSGVTDVIVEEKGFDLKRYVQRKYNVTRNSARKTVLETGNDNSIEFAKSVIFSLELKKIGCEGIV